MAGRVHLLCLLCILNLCWPSIVRSDEPAPLSEDATSFVPQVLLSLVHTPEVQRELQLSRLQIQQLESLFTEVDGPWFRARNLPAEKRRFVIAQQEQRIHQWFQSHASQAQAERLRQLEYRAQDVRMLLRKDVGRELSLSPQQIERLRHLAEATDDTQANLQRAQMRAESTEALEAEAKDAAEKEHKSIETALQPAQLRKAHQLLGAAFDTRSLQRIYPMAPELIDVKYWINSEPLKLRQLRGKVVLVHFYAFQCHNCHANFAHYRRWHQQLRDAGVVVIGIQTPETSRERDPNAVRQAAVEYNLEFPILVDLESTNWKAWSNTMWPTVYVVDRRGYIRHWWQGELNWQGATADKTIEQLVQRLLEEAPGI